MHTLCTRHANPQAVREKVTKITAYSGDRLRIGAGTSGVLHALDLLLDLYKVKRHQ